MRHLRMPVRVGFIQASSYRGTATAPGRLDIFPQLLPDLKDQHVLLVDDILDTGQTLLHLIHHLQQRQPASIRTAVLLRKLARLKVDLQPDYCGFDIPDKFVIGYGLDFNDQYRQLPYIAEMSEEGQTG
jgi:hypoxanthine phosphoribosyltransferase